MKLNSKYLRTIIGQLTLCAFILTIIDLSYAQEVAQNNDRYILKTAILNLRRGFDVRDIERIITKNSHSVNEYDTQNIISMRLDMTEMFNILPPNVILDFDSEIEELNDSLATVTINYRFNEKTPTIGGKSFSDINGSVTLKFKKVNGNWRASQIRSFINLLLRDIRRGR